MSWPAFTGSDQSVLVTPRSAEVPTVVVAMAVLLPGVGSGVVLATVTVLTIVPTAVLALTFTTSVKLAVVAYAATVAMVQITVPVPPTAGTVQLKVGPSSWVNETKVVPAGMRSLIVTL